MGKWVMNKDECCLEATFQFLNYNGLEVFVYTNGFSLCQ